MMKIDHSMTKIDDLKTNAATTRNSLPSLSHQNPISQRSGNHQKTMQGSPPHFFLMDLAPNRHPTQSHPMAFAFGSMAALGAFTPDAKPGFGFLSTAKAPLSFLSWGQGS